MDMALPTIKNKVIVGFFLTILLLFILNQFIQNMAHREQFNIGLKELKQLKKDVLTRHHCPSGLKIILYYKKIENNEKLAKIWIDKMNECLDRGDN